VSQDALLLRARRIEYLSRLDEDIFFEWLGKVACVSGIEGVGDELHITVSVNKVDDACLRELLAIFFRYQISMKQLAAFRDDQKRKWFSNVEAYWYSKVFVGNEEA
jgi:hypothetical protein